MTNYTPDEIISALTVIREVCKSHESEPCAECELYDTACHVCSLDEYEFPRNWSLMEENPKIWRAFR